MIKASLHLFVDHVLEAGRIGPHEISMLQHDLFPAGLQSREEADILIALDRAVADTDAAWGAYLVATVARFVVASAGTTGAVGRDTARWLVSSLSCGSGPTVTASRIALEAIRSARQVDEELLVFAALTTRLGNMAVEVLR